MKKAKAKGLFERPAGSGCWWINYYADGSPFSGSGAAWCPRRGNGKAVRIES
jgi:hypothetical protein